MKCRTREKIAMEILRSALEPSKKTTIMYRCLLTLPQLREYLPLLVERGLLEFIGEDKLYKTSLKGVRILKTLEQLEMVFRPSDACSPSPTFQELRQYRTPSAINVPVLLFSPANGSKELGDNVHGQEI